MIPSPIPGAAFLAWLRVTYASGGISTRKLLHLFPWIIRYSILELPRVYERLRYDREIARQAVPHDPVFILGHWRSGTSRLQELLCSDTRFATLTAFDAMFPECMLSTRRWLPVLLDRSLQIFDARYRAQDRPLRMSQPAEDDFYSLCMSDPDSAYWGHLFPRQARNRFLQSKVTAGWLDGHRYMLKKLRLAYPGKRLLLKSPPNTIRIAELKREHPDAQFIFIHRHPFDTFASTCRLWRMIGEQTMLQSIDQTELEDLILDIQVHTYKQYLEARGDLSTDDLVEISLSDLGEAPLRTIQSIYTRLGLGKLPVKALERELRAVPDPVLRNYEFTPETKEKLADRLDFAMNAWNYEPYFSRRISNSK